MNISTKTKWRPISDEITKIGRDRAVMCICTSCMKSTRLIQLTFLKLGTPKECKKCSVTTHGKAKSRIWNIWAGMKARCNNPNEPAFKNYGGRGIRLCEQWSSFPSFHSWAQSSGYTEDLSIERIDVNLGYSPENCTWIPKKKQARNRRITLYTSYKGNRIPVGQLAEQLNIPYPTLWKRIIDGIEEKYWHLRRCPPRKFK